MNKDNLRRMKNALDERRSDLAYNITQRAGAELVLHVLREDVWHWSKKDGFEDKLGQKIVEWYNEVWVDIATPKNPFDMKMDMYIRNIMEKLRTEWYYDPEFAPPPDLEFGDLFRLLMGTVHIPLSAEITTMIIADDSVLTERNDVKTTLLYDQRWIEILKNIANGCGKRHDESKTVCDSIVEYSIPELDRQRVALQNAKLEDEVSFALLVAFNREETDSTRPTTNGKRIQIGDMQTLLCRMKQMC
jgi:hypothetical protein